MHNNEELIRSFYKAFQQKDFKTMQESYSDYAVFKDPVFEKLNSIQVKSMWEMFCVNGKDLKIEFSKIEANDLTASARWKAHYTFRKTGKQVTNRIKAFFIIENGKIISHIDHFNFYWWTKQALGVKGLFLGWTPFVKNKVQENALKSLNLYMKRNNINFK